MRTKKDHCVRRFGGTLGTLMRAALGDHWGTKPSWGGGRGEDGMGGGGRTHQHFQKALM